MNPIAPLSVIYVGLGGAAGSVVRYALTVSVQGRAAAGFPIATLLINIAGSFLLGGLMGYFAEEATASAELRLLLTSGFCGGFTTFSTFTWETYALLRDGEHLRAAVCITASVAVSL